MQILLIIFLFLYFVFPSYTFSIPFGETPIDLPKDMVPEYFSAEDFCTEECCRGPLTRYTSEEDDNDADFGDKLLSVSARVAYPHTIDSLHHRDANLALTALEGAPSATVAGCVNAISGSYFESQTDLVVPSALALLVQRTYCSSEGEWSFRHEPVLRVESGGTSHIYGSYRDDGGSAMRYRRRNHLGAATQLNLPSRLFKEYGLTNCASEEIGGQTNWRNSSLNFVRMGDEKCYLLRHGSRVDRVFKSFKRIGSRHKSGAPQGKFHLSEERHPNGNRFTYHYDDEDKLISIHSVNKADQILSTLSVKKGDHYSMWASDQRHVSYQFDFTSKRLLHVRSTNAIPVSYLYDEKGRMLKRELPEGRFLKVAYCPSGKDRGKVHTLSAPVGVGGSVVNTHSFSYQQGKTAVWDAAGHLTFYLFDQNTKRLDSIQHFDHKGQLISCEILCWAPNESSQAGNLLSRSFNGADGVSIARQLQYDGHDNIIEERLWGNLTGKSLGECYIKTFKITQDGRNLPAEQNDGRKQLVFTYYPESNLIKSRLTKANGQVLKREFFTYNDHGDIEEEIWDDGTGEESDDLTGITERHRKWITAREQAPIGLPQIIEEFYLDRTANQYVQLKKTVNTHSPEGKILSQEHYGSDGLLAYTQHFEYDRLGNVTKETNALGEETIRRFDSLGNKTYEQGPDLSFHKEFVYDLANRLVQEKEIWANGEILTLSHRYNALSQRIASIDIYGSETTYAYDALGRPVSGKYPSIYNAANNLIPIEERCEYDSLGNIKTKWDTNGQTTKMAHTARGKPYLIEYPDGSKERKTYTLDGLLEREISKNGLVTEYSYDALGNVVQTKVLDPSGLVLKTASAVYQGSKVVAETDAAGYVTYYEYDDAGRKVAVIREDHRTQYVFDPLGRIAKTIEWQNGSVISVTAKEYDLLDRVIEERVEDEFGQVFHKEQYSYHANGKRSHVIAHSEQGVSVTETTYTPRGEIESITDAHGNVTRYTYNYSARHREQWVLQVTCTDPLGNSQIKTHDTLGQVAELIHVNAFGDVTKKEEYVYDPNGNRLQSKITVITPGGSDKTILTEWKYDSMGNVIDCYEAVGTPEQKHTRYTYHNGQKETIVTPNGVTISHVYDSIGRLVQFRASDKSFDYTYEYDLLGRPICIEDHVQKTKNVRVYDHAGNILSETLNHGSTIACTYDAVKRPVTVTLPDASKIEYHYHPHALQKIVRTNSQGVSYSSRYRYDLAGNILQHKLMGETGTIDYQYDLLHRPVKTKSPCWEETIPQNGYDAAGNLVHRDVVDSQGICHYRYAYDDLYQLIEEAGDVLHTYTHDSNCNRVSKDGQTYEVNALNQLTRQTDCAYVYDANGCLLEQINGEETVSYRYDALNRLVEVNSSQDKIAYIYDSFNRRISKIENGRQTHYLYHGQNEIGIICEGKITQLRILGNGYGKEVGAAVLLELEGEAFVPIHDSFGNVIALMDMQKNLVESYRYSAFGEMQVFNKGRQINNPWRFSSKRLDEETGLFYFGERYYSPVIGRWITPDPAGFADGPNLYAYVHNQPLIYIDPDGQFAMFLIPLAISLAIDYCVPAAATYVAGCAGMTSAAALLSGMARGYNLDFSAGTFDAIDPSAGFCERLGMGLGAVFAIRPDRLVSKGIATGGKAIANFASRELTGTVVSVTKTALESKVTRSYTWFSSFCVGRSTTNQVAQRTFQIAEGGVAKQGVKRSADFITSSNGITIPTNRTILESGFQGAGFTRFQTRSSGMGYVLPNGNTVRIMDPAGQAPLRASFTNKNGGPINPFTGKPPQPSSGLDGIARRQFVRENSHLELIP